MLGASKQSHLLVIHHCKLGHCEALQWSTGASHLSLKSENETCLYYINGLFKLGGLLKHKRM